MDAAERAQLGRFPQAARGARTALAPDGHQLLSVARDPMVKQHLPQKTERAQRRKHGKGSRFGLPSVSSVPSVVKCFLFLFLSQSAGAQCTLAITNVSVIDATDPVERRDRTVTISGNRI